ncbi:phage tail family protein [Oceanobacillus profundus]|uniref:distal tail protein Dit n=1 Tax=Oceanobacillus profundus TaxID=372463 RepID=UPI00203A82ED|nr:distal tail protein Dit [Oceanobacillus profundus]MCM3396492.1 phage tail family protein [Oceanobacillus profundus]
MNSMTFNGVRKPFVKVVERGRPYWAPRNNEIVSNRGRHRVRKVDTEPVPIPVTLRIEADSKEDLLNKAEEVAEWLNTDKEAPLVFDDRPNRSHWAILNGAVDEEEIVSFSTASLEFISLYKTGATKSINITTTSQQHQITGQVETPWTVEVNFTSNTNRFEFWAGDIYFQLNYSFVAGDRLTVEYTGRKVLLRTRDIRTAVSMSSNFEELKPGTVSVRASHPATLKYDERYY